MITLSVFDDLPSQILFDFAVPGNSLGGTRLRIHVPVLPAMPHQDAAESFNRLDEIDALHDNTNSPTFRTPGTWPPMMSSCKSLR